MTELDITVFGRNFTINSSSSEEDIEDDIRHFINGMLYVIFPFIIVEYTVSFVRNGDGVITNVIVEQ
jgi:hypothetical protein